MSYKNRVVSVYKEAFSNLTESQDWLSSVIDPPIAAEIEDVVSSLRNKEPEFEPLLFDLYIWEVSTAIDRCLSLRRELQEIQASAVNFARQYTRFEKTFELNRLMDDLSAQAEQANKLQQGYKTVATAFSDRGDVLAKGFKQQSEIVSESYGGNAAILKTKNETSNARWEMLKSINDSERRQHMVPGHVLNYSERSQRLRALLRRDLTEAWKKSIAVREGINIIYGAGSVPDLPAESDVNILDKAVEWVRKVIEFLERKREQEVEFDMVIPLIQPSKDKDGKEFGLGGNASSFTRKSDGFVVNVTPWLNAMFQDKAGAVRITSLRLRELGVSFVSGDIGKNDVRTTTIAVVVFPPETRRSLDRSMTPWQVRPPVLFGEVRHLGVGTDVKRESGAAVRNQRVDGEWRVKVLPIATNNGNPALAAEEVKATDLKLHLRVVGIPNNDVSKW